MSALIRIIVSSLRQSVFSLNCSPIQPLIFFNFVSLTANSSLLGGGGGKRSELSHPVHNTLIIKELEHCYNIVLLSVADISKRLPF